MVLGVKDLIARRVAEEINFGDVVNLGIGIPQKVANYIPKEKMVFFQCEDGILGMGPVAEKGKEDPNLVDAGCMPVTIIPGASYFDSAMSFAMIRSGKLDISILGSLEVAENGDLANWMIPGGLVPGMGGAMDLAKKSKRVIAIMMHTDKKGNPKIRKRCELPLTAEGNVSLIITDLAVISVEKRGLVLKEIFETTTVEEVIAKTEAKLIVEEPIKIISVS